jgi:glucokinase
MGKEYGMSALGGIDLGGTKIQAAVVGQDFEVLGEARVPTPTTGGPADVIEAMEGAMREAADAAGVETASLAGVGVGSPGVIDDDAGTVTSARNLPDWEGSFPMRDELASALGASVSIDNDVNVATDAEFALGAAREFSSLLGVFWGTGVGGGIVLDGKRWAGAGAAGEIGHVVVEIGGARCPCGRRGCMEAYAGRGAMELRARKLVDEGRKTMLFKIMEERGRPRLTSGVWKRALDRGDDLAHELVDRAVRALGAGVASAVNVLDVEAVVIGGGLGLKLGEPYADRIRTAMEPHLFASERPPAIRLAVLGDLGGAIGAALLASRR